MVYRCPYCGKFASYTRLDFDVWQCDNCMGFFSSADFEGPPGNPSSTLTAEEIIQVTLLVLFVCLFGAALIVTGAFP